MAVTKDPTLHTLSLHDDPVNPVTSWYFPKGQGRQIEKTSLYQPAPASATGTNTTATTTKHRSETDFINLNIPTINGK